MKRLLVASLVCVLGLAACTSQVGSTHRSAAPTLPSGGRVPLEVAIRDGRDLGPLPSTQPISFDLTLASRDPRGLDALLASGSHVTATVFAERYGPEPARAEAAERALVAARNSMHAGIRARSS